MHAHQGQILPLHTDDFVTGIFALGTANLNVSVIGFPVRRKKEPHLMSASVSGVSL